MTSVLSPSAQPHATSEIDHQTLLSHADALYRYALARVGDSAKAEDLVQDSLLAAVVQLDQFAKRASLRTWLIGILRHKIHDHYRWQRRHPGDQPNVAAADDDNVDSQDPWFSARGVWLQDPNQGLEAFDLNPEQALQNSQLRAVLQFCIDHLPARLRQVFVLRELEGLSPDALSESAEISANSVTVFLYRARQNLRSCIQKRWLSA